MTRKFAVGDKVVRTADYVASYDEGFMQEGNVYTVKAFCNDNEIFLEGGITPYSCTYFELVQPKFSNMKFRVSSPEHSKEIQEALFEMGYKWRSGHTEVKYVNSDWNENIVTSLDGTFKSDRAQPWISEGVQEYTVETTKSYKLIPVEIPKPETIEIDGKTYDKEAVLKRLAELETVQNYH